MKTQTVSKASCWLFPKAIIQRNPLPLPTCCTLHGIPKGTDQGSLLTFLRLVDKVNKGPPAEGGNHSDSPIMVNCSAGVGRMGTFIALSSSLRFHGLFDPSLPTFSHSTPTSSSLLSPLSQLDPIAKRLMLCESSDRRWQRAEQVVLRYQILEHAFLHR